MQPASDVERMERKEEYSPCKLFTVLITRNDLSKHILTSDYSKTGSELRSSLNVHKIHTVEQAISTGRWGKWDKIAARD